MKYVAVFILLSLSCLAQAAENAALDTALSRLVKTSSGSEAETLAMQEIIAHVRRMVAPPHIPAIVSEKALSAQDMAVVARTPEEFRAAALAYTQASRLAPWVGEYHFRRGGLLVKAQRYADARRAFTLYLQATPDANDLTEVRNLIEGLQNLERNVSGVQQTTVSAFQSAKHNPGEGFRDCPDCPEMVTIPAGRFQMGSPPTEQGRYDAEGPQHTVSVPSFALGKYNITQEEFIAFLREASYQPEPCDPIWHKRWKVLGGGRVYPPGEADLPRQPAVCLNWQDAHAYVRWLNKRVPAGRGVYRLPSEAEWEYAVRAMTTTARWWGEGVGQGQANCNGCGSVWDNDAIAPVGSFGPNPFGLYDMLGNVWQWTEDCWNESYADAPTDGSAWVSGACINRVVRGGSWSNVPVFVRSAMRARSGERGQDFDYAGYVGFRVAKSLP